MIFSVISVYFLGFSAVLATRLWTGLLMICLSWEVELRHDHSHQTNISKLKINFSADFIRRVRRKRETQKKDTLGKTTHPGMPNIPLDHGLE